MSRLDPGFLGPPIAHRGLHDRWDGVIENSRAAIAAAVRHGYGVELDLQLSADGEAMVFHDYRLNRLTPEEGRVDTRMAADLTQIPLSGGGGETIPALTDILAIVDGKVPILVELKDQSENRSETSGDLERRTAALLSAYAGPVAVMSFNPHMIIWFYQNAPDLARGLVVYGFDRGPDTALPPSRVRELANLEAFEAAGADFVTYGRKDLPSEVCARLRAAGTPIFTWTIRSEEQAAAVAPYVDNITFEGYLPTLK